jgi:acyl carrier protein
MELKDRLTEVFRRVFDDHSLVLIESMTADDVDGWDSLSHINLILAIELEFGIEFKPNEIQSFENVGELIQCIELKVSVKNMKSSNARG